MIAEQASSPPLPLLLLKSLKKFEYDGLASAVAVSESDSLNRASMAPSEAFTLHVGGGVDLVRPTQVRSKIHIDFHMFNTRAAVVVGLCLAWHAKCLSANPAPLGLGFQVPPFARGCSPDPPRHVQQGGSATATALRRAATCAGLLVLAAFAAVAMNGGSSRAPSALAVGSWSSSAMGQVRRSALPFPPLMHCDTALYGFERKVLALALVPIRTCKANLVIMQSNLGGERRPPLHD